MGRWYQNAVINGVAMPAERRRDTSQRRWRELIEPLVPVDGNGRLFLELGCNAGFYLRKASELGYSTLGVEKEEKFIEQAKYWEAQEPSGVRVAFADINAYEIPANFITLIANVHYWLTPEQMERLVAQLREKSLYVLLVSRHNQAIAHKSDCSLHAAMDLFKDWEAVEARHNEKFYAVLFKNPGLVEYETVNLFNNQPFIRSRKFLPAFREFVDLCVSRRRFNYNHTKYWDYATWRGWKNKAKHHRKLRRKVLEMERFGITEPLLVHEDGIIEDGNHRLIMAEYLGIPRVICRIASCT